MARNNYKSLIAGAIIVAVLLWILLFNLNSSKGSTTNEAKENQAVIIHAAWVKSIWASLFLVAEKMWYFADESIKMDISRMAWGDQVFKALTSKSTDIGFVGLVPYGFVATNFPSIKLVTVVADMNDNKVIANEGMKTAVDFSWKRIGYSKSTASDIGLQQFMKRNTINPSTVQLVNLSPAALPTALYKWEIDWYSAREPNIYNGQKLLSGNAIIFDKQDQKYEWYFSLFADQEYINNNHESMAHLRKALSKAEKYIIENPEATKKLVSEFLNMDMSVLNSIRHDYSFRQSIEQKHLDALKDIFVWAGATWAASVSMYIAQ
jgi:ABC-type nitrate/sulfonate/bicarbonate transport system substrate-binding protein